MINVFINNMPFYVIKSTDIDYAKGLQRIGNELGVDFYIPNNYLWGWKENLYAVINKIFSLLHVNIKISYKYPKELLGRLFHKRSYDIVYSQSVIPIDIGDVPVFFETTFWIPGQNVIKTPETEAIFNNITLPYMEQVLRRKCIVNLKSDCEIENVIRFFPQYKYKLVSLPFLLPNLKAIKVMELRTKHENDEVLKILFVGGQARRKGLPSLIKAYCNFCDENKDIQVELHIVSGYTDGKVNIPEGYNIIEHGKLPSPETLALFRQCHIFAMISQRESYGLVYIEAMANGCLIIARDYYPQKEFVNFGKLGFLAKPNDIISIKEAIYRSSKLSRNNRITMAENALKKFNKIYSYDVTKLKYQALFAKLANMK